MSCIFGIISKNERKYNDFMNNIFEHKKKNIAELLKLYNKNSVDAFGQFRDEKCYLISYRLPDNDRHSHDTPFTLNNIVLAYTGQVQNSCDLRKQLISSGTKFKSLSDSELIIKLYEKDGLDAIKKIIGSISICIYDIKHNEIFIYGDRIGIRPIYYYETDDIVVFSSHLPTVLEFSNSERMKNMDHNVLSYLSYGNIIGNDTFFSDIKIIPSGNYLLIHKQHLSISDYWTLDQEKINYIPDLYETISELKIRISNAISQNIANIIQTQEINVILDGSLENSTLLYFINEAIKNSKKTIKTYSIGFDGNNDFIFSSDLAAKMNTEHTNITCNTDDYVENMIDLIYSNGEPLSNPNDPLFYHVTKQFNTENNIILSSSGFNDLLYGNKKLFLSYYTYLNDTSNPFTDFLTYTFENIPDDYKKNILNNSVKLNHTVFTNKFENIFSQCNELHKQDCIGFMLFNLLTSRSLANYLKVSSTANSEILFPFVNHDVVEFCYYNITRENKIHLMKDFPISELMGKKTNELSDKVASKFILKKMMENIFSYDIISHDSIVSNQKIPLQKIFIEKSDVVCKIFDSGYINKLGLFNIDYIKNNFNELKIKYLNDPTTDTFEHFMSSLWVIINFEIFAQLFIYNKTVSDVKEFFFVDPTYKFEKNSLIEKILIAPDVQFERYLKLYITKSLFDKYDIKYFAFKDTMLGCFRHNSFVPWDDKISIMILEDQCGKLTNDFRLELIYAGLNIQKSNTGFMIYDYLCENELKSNFVIDLYIGKYNELGTQIIYSSQHLISSYPDYAIDVEIIYPLKDYQFGYFTLSGINDPKKYLNYENFGDYLHCSEITDTFRLSTTNYIVRKFLDTYHIPSVSIRDISLINRKDQVVETDDWKSYFNRTKDIIPNDFDPTNYKLLHNDLTNLSDPFDLYIHYIKIGRLENRLYNASSVLPIDFSIKGYKCMNLHLVDLSDAELRAHYVTCGRSNNLRYNIASFLPFNFNSDTYKYLNSNLDSYTENELINHYIHIGKNEGALYDKDSFLPQNFDHERYIYLNPDLKDLGIVTERDTIIHYIKFGRNENRNYK